MGNYFIVASRGLTATTWLAVSLNEHRDVFCCHGRDDPGRGPENRELLRDPGYRQDRLAFEERQRNMLLDDYLELVDKYSRGQRVAGNVHGFMLDELLGKMAASRNRENIRIANMVRHPITLVESYVALVCHRRDDYPEKFEKEHLPRLKWNAEVARRCEVPGYDAGSPEVFGFVEACYAMSKMADELLHSEIVHIQMERMVSDPEYFFMIFNHLTGGTVRMEDAVLKTVFSRQPLNSHRHKVERRLGARLKDDNEAATGWPSWKQRVFDYFLTPERKKRFEMAGYFFPCLPH